MNWKQILQKQNKNLEIKSCDREGWQDVSLVKKGRRRVPEDYVEFQMPMDSVTKSEDWLVIKWYASTPSIDSGNDIVKAEAFQKNVAMERYLKNPIILRSHDTEKVLWVMTRYKIDKWGLWIEAELRYDIEGVFEQIQDWVVRAFSIGFIPREMEFRHIDWRSIEEIPESERKEINIRTDIIREISEIELYEISVVNIWANKDAIFTLSKAVKSFFTPLLDITMFTKQMQEQLEKLATKAESGILTEKEKKAYLELIALKGKAGGKVTEEKDEDGADPEDEKDKDENKDTGGDNDEGEDWDDDKDEKEEANKGEDEDEGEKDWDEDTGDDEGDGSETDPTPEEGDDDEHEEKKSLETKWLDVKALAEKAELAVEKAEMLGKGLAELFDAYEELATKHLELVEKFNKLPRSKALVMTGKAGKPTKTLIDEMKNAKQNALGN